MHPWPETARLLRRRPREIWRNDAHRSTAAAARSRHIRADHPPQGDSRRRDIAPSVISELAVNEPHARDETAMTATAPQQFPLARRSAGHAPPRRPASIRRTTSIDCLWPEGLGQPFEMV